MEQRSLGRKTLFPSRLLHTSLPILAGSVPQRPLCNPTGWRLVLESADKARPHPVPQVMEPDSNPESALRSIALSAPQTLHCTPRRSDWRQATPARCASSPCFQVLACSRLSVFRPHQPASAGGLSVVPSEDYSHAPPCYAVFSV